MAGPSLAVWKFASCDGCQLTVLDCEDELLQLAETVHIAHFLEATSAVAEGPYDVSLVEGSITTEDDVERIRSVRERSRILVTIGACATAGGIQPCTRASQCGSVPARVGLSRVSVASDSVATNRKKASASGGVMTVSVSDIPSPARSTHTRPSGLSRISMTRGSSRYGRMARVTVRNELEIPSLMANQRHFPA